MNHVSQATLTLTINALDDVPRTVRELHQRVDLWSPRTIGGALRKLETQGFAVAFEEPGRKSAIIRKRYRRVSMSGGTKSAKHYEPHSLDKNDPGYPELDYGLRLQTEDNAFCEHMRRLIAEGQARPFAPVSAMNNE